MTHLATQTSWPSRFAPLVAYLATQTDDAVTLSLAQIEAIIGVPLSVTATVSQAWWVSGSERHVRDLQAIGWRAHLNVKVRQVLFRRSATALREG